MNYSFITREEVEFNSFLSRNKFHPLNYMNISEIKLIGKTRDFKLYEFFNDDCETFQTLKVMTNQKLFNVEKQILKLVEGRRISVELKNEFTYQQERNLFSQDSQKDLH